MYGSNDTKHNKLYLTLARACALAPAIAYGEGRIAALELDALADRLMVCLAPRACGWPKDPNDEICVSVDSGFCEVAMSSLLE
jgi:hypothetical protein